MNKKRTVYVDMDHVLCDFDKSMIDVMVHLEHKYGKKYENLSYENKSIANWKYVMSLKERFWSDMSWLPGSKNMWSFITKNFKNVKILSSAGVKKEHDSYPYTGKILWLKKNVPLLDEKNIIIVSTSSLKSYYSKPEDILIDDMARNITQWESRGGIGIFHTKPEKTIEELKQYI